MTFHQFNSFVSWQGMTTANHSSSVKNWWIPHQYLDEFPKVHPLLQYKIHVNLFGTWSCKLLRTWKAVVSSIYRINPLESYNFFMSTAQITLVMILKQAAMAGVICQIHKSYLLETWNHTLYAKALIPIVSGLFVFMCTGLRLLTTECSNLRDLSSYHQWDKHVLIED